MVKVIRLLALMIILVCITLAVSFSFLINFYPYDDKRVIESILLVCTLVWILLGGLKQYQNWPNWPISLKACIFTLLSFAVISSFLAASPRHAFLELSLFIGLFYLSVLICSSWHEQSNKLLLLLISSIAVGAVLYMIGFYTGYLASFLEAIPLEWPEPFFMFSNVRAFNQYQLWTLGLLCLPLLVSVGLKNNHKLWIFAGLSKWWVLLFASGSRGVLAAWLLSMLVTWWVYRRFARSFLVLQIKCCAIGFATYLLLFVWLPKFNQGGGSVITTTVLRAETSDRLGLWRLAGAMIEAHPWLGVGPMHYAWYPNPLAAHPHNSLIQLACEFGLPATGLIVFILGYGIYRWWQRFNVTTLSALPERDGQLAIVLFFTVVAEAIYSLVDGVIVMPLSQVMMAVVLGLMMGLYQQNQTTLPVSPIVDLSHRLLAGVTLVVLVWAVLPELIPRILGDYDQVPVGNHYQIMAPRFWQEGGIPH
jgi:putative inorganic carbon (HCO3(-)) transporter